MTVIRPQILCQVPDNVNTDFSPLDPNTPTLLPLVLMRHYNPTPTGDDLLPVLTVLSIPFSSSTIFSLKVNPVRSNHPGIR